MTELPDKSYNVIATVIGEDEEEIKKTMNDLQTETGINMEEPPEFLKKHSRDMEKIIG